MEITKLSVCRLCAQNIRADGIIGQLNDIDLDIESKLIICCQWNGTSETQCDGMPQDVCAACYQNLHQSWNFAVQVRAAQVELHSKLMIRSIAADAEQIHDFDMERMDHAEFKVETEIHAYSPLSVLQQIDDFVPIEHTGDFDELNSVKSDEKQAHTDAENAIDEFHIDAVDEYAGESDSEQPQQTAKRKEANFLDSINKSDRNADGTIKSEAVERLGLDNWSIIEYKCYLCQVQLPDHYDWRSHMKIEHPGQPFRHLCNICNMKDYIQRKPLFKHVMTNHRRYFKYWWVNEISFFRFILMIKAPLSNEISFKLIEKKKYRTRSCRKCYAYYWDLNRLRSHSVGCKRTETAQICDICGKEAKNTSVLRIHRKVHFEQVKRTFECYLCRKALLSRGNLKHHILVTHLTDNAAIHKCDYCGKAFSRLNKRNRHRRTHLNVFPFECSYCQKKFRYKNKLNVSTNFFPDNCQSIE